MGFIIGFDLAARYTARWRGTKNGTDPLKYTSDVRHLTLMPNHRS